MLQRETNDFPAGRTGIKKSVIHRPVRVTVCMVDFWHFVQVSSTCPITLLRERTPYRINEHLLVIGIECQALQMGPARILHDKVIHVNFKSIRTGLSGNSPCAILQRHPEGRGLPEVSPLKGVCRGKFSQPTRTSAWRLWIRCTVCAAHAWPGWCHLPGSRFPLGFHSLHSRSHLFGVCCHLAPQRGELCIHHPLGQIPGVGRHPHPAWATWR